MIKDFVPVNSLLLGISRSTLLCLLCDPGGGTGGYFTCAIRNDVVPVGGAGGTLTEEGIFSSVSSVLQSAGSLAPGSCRGQLPQLPDLIA